MQSHNTTVDANVIDVTRRGTESTPLTQLFYFFNYFKKMFLKCSVFYCFYFKCIFSWLVFSSSKKNYVFFCSDMLSRYRISSSQCALNYQLGKIVPLCPDFQSLGCIGMICAIHFFSFNFLDFFHKKLMIFNLKWHMHIFVLSTEP